MSINELKVAGVSVAIWLRGGLQGIENRNLQTSLLIVANRPDLGSVNKIFPSRSNTLRVNAAKSCLLAWNIEQ